MQFNRALCILVPAACGWAAPSVAASDEPPGPLEEVVVSALRETNAEDMDASISIMDRSTVESAALVNFQELVPLVPNMNLSSEGSRARYFQLRGIGELEQYEGAPNPSVGYIVDDIDLSGVGGINNLFDVSRVEVLRGPQATRFGANALGGLIYVQSADPEPGSSGNVELTLGSDDTVAAGVSFGGELGERLAGRFSVHRHASDGFHRNVFLGVDDSNGRDELVGRGKLQWELGNVWSARLSVLYADFNDGYDAWAPDNGRNTYTDHPGRDEQQTTGASLRISGPISDGADLVSITGHADSAVLFSFDGEWGNAAYWEPYGYDYVYSDVRDRRTLSQEFRLLSSPAGRLLGGRTDWVVGVYAQRLEESNDILSAGTYDDSADAPFNWCAPCLDRSRLRSAYDSTNLAVFGKLDSQVGDRLSLSAGARLERWNADYADAFTDEIWGDPGQPVRHRFSPDANLWGLNLGVNYDLSEHRRVYAAISRGYKAGGFNPSLARALGGSPATGAVSIAFEPESLWNYEAGLRGLWLDNRLEAELSVFYMDRRNMQLRSSAQFTDNPNDFVFVTSNAEGRSLGLEGSVRWQLDDAWSLHGSLGLLRSEVEAYRLEREADIAGDLVGRAFAHAPPYTLNLGFSYAAPEEGGWFARLDFNAAGAFYFDYSHDEKAVARQVVNLRVGRQWASWEAYAWVRNLFDEQYFERGFSFGLAPPLFERTRFTRLGDPRHYGVNVNYRF